MVENMGAAMPMVIAPFGATVPLIIALFGAAFWFGRQVGTRIDDLRTDMNRRFEEMGNRLDDTNKRIDVVARDVASLRDRTGVIEGSLAGFMRQRHDPSAA